MGGCVISCFQSKNSSSVVPYEAHVNYLKIGRDNVVCAPPSENCSATYRFHEEAGKTDEELYAYYNGNLYDRLQKTVEKLADRPAIGIRPVDRIEKVEIDVDGQKKPWEFVHLKPTVKFTFRELMSKIEAFGHGLRELGATSASRIAIYEDTRAEWLISCFGMWSQGMTGVTVYSSLGEDALEYALKEADVHFVVTNGRLVKNLLKITESAEITTPTIIYCDSLPSDFSPADVTSPEGASIRSFDEVIAIGQKASDNSAHNPSLKPDDVAIIMYTSGTTGAPKGVVMTHGNLHSAVSCLTPRLNMYFPDPNMPVNYLGYLPLAHILEFTFEITMLLRGSFVGYGTPRTLTDATAKPHGDLREFRPHYLAGVPRIFDTLRKAIDAIIAPGLKRRLFDAAYQDRRKFLLEGKDTPYYNEHVFGSIREFFGGNLLGLFTGGAPISPKTQEYIRIVSGGELAQGYGLTETCAITSVQLPGDQTLGIIGALQLGTEVKLRDVDEWKHTDKPHPRGEILIRGPCISKGYYRQPEKTAEAFYDDGWFATGDVGQLDESTGQLKIIGRVKALAKNAYGEYIALDAIEAICVLNPLAMPNGVCVVVDSQKAYICALVLTDESKAMKFAKANNIPGTWPTVLENPAFQAAASKSFAATAREHGRKPFECVRHVRVLADEWSPQNGVYTAAFKLKRRVVDEMYKDLITELFKDE